MAKREILFRGKRVDNGEWVEGSLLQSEATVGGRTNCEIVSRFALSNDIGRYKVDPPTIGQLLHIEKNGRKWFEGDVAEMEAVAHISGHTIYGDDEYLHYKYTGVVETHVRHGLCIRVHKCLDVDNDEEIIFSKNLRKAITFSRTEIIGTIHDTHLTQQS